jgi:hypothetical protein
VVAVRGYELFDDHPRAAAIVEYLGWLADNFEAARHGAHWSVAHGEIHSVSDAALDLVLKLTNGFSGPTIHVVSVDDWHSEPPDD